MALALLAANTGCATTLEREEVEQPRYEVLKEAETYEVRAYPAQIVARVKVEGRDGGAMNKGFRPLADYIFGNNTKRDEIAMTSPVTQTAAKESMKIEMTSPVTQTAAEDEGDEHWVMFIMPSEHTMDDLPEPNNDRVELVEIPAQTMAVIRFSGFGGAGMMEKKRGELLDALDSEGIPVVGQPTYARYDPPWTMPWMRRNEVMIPVEYAS